MLFLLARTNKEKTGLTEFQTELKLFAHPELLEYLFLIGVSYGRPDPNSIFGEGQFQKPLYIRFRVRNQKNVGTCCFRFKVGNKLLKRERFVR